MEQAVFPHGIKTLTAVLNNRQGISIRTTIGILSSTQKAPKKPD
jgi:hypothetical protein